MVANGTMRKIEAAINKNLSGETSEEEQRKEKPVLHDRSDLQTSPDIENHESTYKDETQNPCVYKPLSSPILRHRKQPVSMFQVQPKAVKEIVEVQEICIERGGQQHVKESVTILPELTSSLPYPDESGLPVRELNSAYPVTTASEANVRQMTENPISPRGMSQSPDSHQHLRKIVVGKDNGWMGLGSKVVTPRIPSCPTTPTVSPSTRRRSVGVLTTPAWSLRTFREPDEMKSKCSPSLRRRSLVLPARHYQEKQSPGSPRKKSLISADVSELTTRNDSMSNSGEELTKSSQEQQLQHDQNENNSHQSQSDLNEITEERSTEYSDEEFEDFRPRLRSRSLDDYRTEARENVLQNQQRPCFHEPAGKRRENRRKSFEAWLTDKEQETIKKLQMLTLEKQRAAQEEAKRKEQRKGKTYEEWLNEKNNMAEVNEDSLGKKEETTKVASQERQQTAKSRYEKWLMEKETQALEKEKEMLKQAKLKTTEMRKKYEEKKKNRLKLFASSLFS